MVLPRQMDKLMSKSTLQMDAHQNQTKTTKPQNKSVFRLANPGKLEQLEPLQCPQTTTRGSQMLQLPITPMGASLHSMTPQQCYTPQVSRQFAPVTPSLRNHPTFYQQPIAQPDCTIEDERFGVSIRKTQYRNTQEDRFLVKDCFLNEAQNACFAVFDGHGGQKAAEFCKERLAQMLESHPGIASKPMDSAKQVFKKLDEDFLLYAKQNDLQDGSTCLLGLILNGKLTIANLGDSVATLVRKDSSWKKLNEEHVPDRPDERMRIESSNGHVFRKRIRGDLGVSRAFGNMEMKDLVIAEPEGQTWPLNSNDDLLVLASDGLYRSYSQEYVIKRILELRAQGLSLGKVAETILEDCVTLTSTIRPCQDNLTLMIVSLSDYLSSFESKVHASSLQLPAQCKVEKAMSGNSLWTKNVFADVSGIGNSSESNHSAYEQSQISSIGHSAGSSTKSSPQQYFNPKSEGLASSNDANMCN